jgi:hypothetical protein
MDDAKVRDYSFRTKRKMSMVSGLEHAAHWHMSGERPVRVANDESEEYLATIALHVTPSNAHNVAEIAF